MQQNKITLINRILRANLDALIRCHARGIDKNAHAIQWLFREREALKRALKALQ